MKAFKDGDQICIVQDDFADLAESSAVFLPLDSKLGRYIDEFSLDGLPEERLRSLRRSLARSEEARMLEVIESQRRQLNLAHAKLAHCRAKARRLGYGKAITYAEYREKMRPTLDQMRARIDELREERNLLRDALEALG